MADSEPPFANEGRNCSADNTRLHAKRPPHAFSIEKILSVTSTAPEIGLRTKHEDSTESVSVGEIGGNPQALAENPQLTARAVNEGTSQYRHCSYGRPSTMTSVVSADSSSVGLRPGCCSDCEDDQEMSLEEEMEDLMVQTSPGAVVSTTLNDVDGSKQVPNNGEFHFLYFQDIWVTVWGYDRDND
jgi:hypothetical protein